MATATTAHLKFPRGSLELPWNEKTATAPIRVMTVDRDPLVREGFAAVIRREPGMELAAQACGMDEALAAYRELQPDVIILDLAHLEIAAGELARLLEALPGARIVAVTASRGDVHMLRILEAGVQGLLLKGTSGQELLDVIRQVHAGKKVVPRPIAAAIAEHLADESLTPREIQVLQLVARGNRNKEIAARLSIADETVRMHMKNILGKLGANDRTHAVTIALTRGFFQLQRVTNSVNSE